MPVQTVSSSRRFYISVVKRDSRGADIEDLDSRLEVAEDEVTDTLNFLEETEPKTRFMIVVDTPVAECGYCGDRVRPDHWLRHRLEHMGLRKA